MTPSGQDKVFIEVRMNTIEVVKIAWREKFSSEIPCEFVTRLECVLTKLENNPEVKSTELFSLVKNETKSKIEELNNELRREEYFFEVMSSLYEDGNMQSQESETQDQTEVEISALYATVNKQAKSKSSESETHEEYVGNQNVTVTDTSSIQGDNSHYEDIDSVQKNAVGSLKSQNKSRGSVKAKIKMFERSDSSSGEEVTSAGAEGEYARLVLKAPQLPPVSPKPSPAARRRPRPNDYEEICLPNLGNNSNPKTTDLAVANTQSSNSSQQTVNTDKCPISSNCLSSKQEGCNTDNKVERKNSQQAKLNISVQSKKPAPPVPMRRSRGNECINTGDSNVLKKTEQLTLQYSEHEPQVATSRKQRCSDEDIKHVERIRPDDIHVHKHIEQSGEGIEGDYCAIADIKKTNEKHVTLVQVTSNNRKLGNNSAGGSLNKAVLSVKKSDKELSRSHDNLSQVGLSGRLDSSSSLSKSLDNFQQNADMKLNESDNKDDDDEDDGYSHLNFTKFESQPVQHTDDNKMKKIFHRKNSGNISTGESANKDMPDAVVGTRYKSLSSESEEDLGSTANINIDELCGDSCKSEELDTNLVISPDLSDSDSKSDTGQSKSPELRRTVQSRRQRVPDYEKWDFQHLLTQTGISIAENENLTDTGSEDETVYDNVPEKHEFEEQVAGQSDDSGVLVSETSVVLDETVKPYEQCDITDGLAPERQDESAKSTSTEVSRMSTACKYKFQYKSCSFLYHIFW